MGDALDSAAVQKVKELPRYDTLESYAGGMVDYVAPGDEPVFPGIDWDEVIQTVRQPLETY